MYEIALRDFRGFRHQDFVPIAPITILVGENSAGKSSFLSALKYILDFTSGDEEPSFNKDPFQLGTFQQIAHFRGGKAGRARSFSMTVRVNVAKGRRTRTNSDFEEAEFTITFVSADSQAAVSQIELSTKNGKLVSEVESGNFKVRVLNNRGEFFPIEDMRGIPRVARVDFARYWPFLLRDLRFRIMRNLDPNQRNLLNDGVDSTVVSLIETAEALSRELTGKVEATSAIRTKPQRTYTPGTEKIDGEGSHVPFEIAKLYRSRNKDEWKRLKASIDAFGEYSEMFKEISVKAFGKSVSDPFQIQFSSDGPKMNLVDLGYGTSQILPILYNLTVSGRRNRHLIQQPEVHLHPKAQAALGDFFVNTFIDKRLNFILETHSDFIVDRIRNSIFKNIIKKEDVSILFFERSRLENKITPIRLDDFGEPVDPPDSYRAFFIGEQLRNLGAEDDANN